MGEHFFQRVLPQKVPAPQLLLWNVELANSLFIANKWQSDAQLLSQYFSGNNLPNGAESIALAYSGHQFGHFNPQLGDGRAHLLGEVLDKSNIRRDVQLKGSGQTAFSRRGDGKCALAPALREYIMSEALYALGVPTSRCLAVVSTGEKINRGLAKAGAVVTRVAASHIRVGTFQYFAARGDLLSLKKLLNYSIERHFPQLNNEKSSDEQRLLSFLEKVMAKQIILIIEWLRVGFIHGVMNTDNTAICGETIDFGPCAMMGDYDENAVFSSIDEYGRYAFSNQGKIAQWNMARLADCLLPLLIGFIKDTTKENDNDENDSEQALEQQALTKIEELIHQYTTKFDEAYYVMYANKIGMNESCSVSKTLVDGLLAIMQKQSLDYTHTFHQLTQSLTDSEQAEQLKSVLGGWYATWLSALKQVDVKPKQNTIQIAQALMAKNNPVVIPRNHHVEAILTRCEEAIATDVQQLSPFDTINSIVGEFLRVLHSPYHELDGTEKYQDAPADGNSCYQTFCGT